MTYTFWNLSITAIDKVKNSLFFIVHFTQSNNIFKHEDSKTQRKAAAIQPSRHIVSHLNILSFKRLTLTFYHVLWFFTRYTRKTEIQPLLSKAAVIQPSRHIDSHLNILSCKRLTLTFYHVLWFFTLHKKTEVQPLLRLIWQKIKKKTNKQFWKYFGGKF